MRKLVSSATLFVILGPACLVGKDIPWTVVSPSLIKSCSGKIKKASTGKVKVPRIGNVRGVPDNPSCGSTVPTFGISVDWSSDGTLLPKPFSDGDQNAVKCKDVFLSIPADAKVCAIYYYKSDEKGRGFGEDGGIRNSSKSRKHKFARKGKTLTRVVGKHREFKVEYKNWRRKYNRYFGYEVWIEQPRSSSGAMSPTPSAAPDVNRAPRGRHR